MIDTTTDLVFIANHPSRLNSYDSVRKLIVPFTDDQLFRDWLWKMHNLPQLSFREIQQIEDEALRLEYSDFNSIKAIVSAKDSIKLVSDSSIAPIISVLDRYRNYLNSSPIK